MIRAIETHYAGCRFRSRLEARWAVFLDALGIRWEYEAQGFTTPAGRYLPDFWLPEHRTWLEIKGTVPDERDLAKCTHVAAALPEADRFFILIGDVPRTPMFDETHGPLGIRCIAWVSKQADFTGFAGEPSAWWLPALKDLPQALVAARSARFEHGERP